MFWLILSDKLYDFSHFYFARLHHLCFGSCRNLFRLFLSCLALVTLSAPAAWADVFGGQGGKAMEWGYGGISFGLTESGASQMHYWDALWKHNNDFGRYILVHKRFRLKYKDRILTDQEGVSFATRIKGNSWSLFFGDLYYREWRRDNLKLPLFGLGMEFRPSPSWNLKAYALSGKFHSYRKKSKGLISKHRATVVSDIMSVNRDSSEKLISYSGALLGYSWRHTVSGVVYRWRSHALIRNDASFSDRDASFVPHLQWGLMNVSMLLPQKDKEVSSGKGKNSRKEDNFQQDISWGKLFPGSKGVIFSGVWPGERKFSWDRIGYVDMKVRWANALVWAYQEKSSEIFLHRDIIKSWRSSKNRNQFRMTGRQRVSYMQPDWPVGEMAIGGLLPFYFLPLHVHLEYLDSEFVQQKRYGLWLHRSWQRGHWALGWSHTNDLWQNIGVSSKLEEKNSKYFSVNHDGGVSYQQIGFLLQYQWEYFNLSSRAVIPFRILGSMPQPRHQLAGRSSQGIRNIFVATSLRVFLYQKDCGSKVFFSGGIAYHQSSPIDPMTRWGQTPRYMWYSQYGFQPWWLRLSWRSDWGEIFFMLKGYGKGDLAERQFQWNLEIRL